MADLQAIYDEFGLSGLVPYALRSGTKGSQMLIDKVKGGDCLYLIKSVLNAPYLVVKDSEYQALAFTSMAAAEAKQQELAASRFDTTIDQLLTGDGREGAIRDIFDDGPTSLFIDEAASIPLGLLTELPNYDGQPNEEHLLRNSALNGATFYYLQIACAQMGNVEAERRWAEKMLNGRFLVAVEDRPIDGYPALTTAVKKKTCLLVYSDWRQMSMDFEQLPAGLTVSFDELDELLARNPSYAAMLNHPSCHLILDQNMMLTIRQIMNTSVFEQKNMMLEFGTGKGTSTPALLQVPEEEWDSVDPTPDWLK